MKNVASHAYQIENEALQSDGTVRFDYANVTDSVPVEKTVYFQNGSTGWQMVVPPEAIDRLSVIISDPVLFNAILVGGEVKGMRAISDRK